ncbi:MAG: hypothetical protein V1797_08190 [Pseudomonadota bacterium]
MQPLSLSGLRYCRGLRLVNLLAGRPADAAQAAQGWDRRQANLALVTGRRVFGGQALSLTLVVDAAPAPPAADPVRGACGMPPAGQFCPAALVTAYPLTSCLPLTWRLTLGLMARGVTPQVLATSPAAAVVALPAGQLQAALAVMPELVDLPAGAEPQCQQVRVVEVAPGQDPPRHCQAPETIAVFREDPIRTYGLAATPHLTWLTAAAPLADLDFARGLAALAEAPKPAHLQVTMAEGRLELCACLGRDEAGHLLRALAGAGLQLCEPPQEATLIHLQGPHFGDRHGIASAALMALAEAGALPLGLAGVVHSLFMAVPPAQAAAVLTALGRRFCAPS